MAPCSLAPALAEPQRPPICPHGASSPVSASCPGPGMVCSWASAPTVPAPLEGTPQDRHGPPLQCGGGTGSPTPGGLQPLQLAHPLLVVGRSLPAPLAHPCRELRNEAGARVTPVSGEGPAPFVPAKSSSWEGRLGWGLRGVTAGPVQPWGRGIIAHCQRCASSSTGTALNTSGAPY